MEDKKKVLYLVDSSTEWIDVAKKLKENNGCEPVYWMTYPLNEEKVKKEFPNIIHHCVFDAYIGVYPDTFHDVKYPLDKEIIHALLEHEKVALKMMDRQDPDQSFTYHERKRFYYNQLTYWLFILKKLSINVLFTSLSPHIPSKYICYTVCKYLKIQTIILGMSTIPGLMFFKRSIKDVPTIRIVPEDINQASNSRNKYELIKSYIHNMSKEYSDAKPPCIKGLEKLDKLERNKYKKLIRLISINKWPSYLKNNIFSLGKATRNNIFKKSGYLIEDSRVTYFERKRIKYRCKKKIDKLEKTYNNMCQAISFNKKYLYFPLQYQPEKSSSPEGDIYADQWLVINMLSCLLPKSWILYVKEHPGQFGYGEWGCMGRTIDFYKDINKFKNVKMVDSKINPFKLIDNAKAVVTLTGTSGLEAVLRGIPALVFGYAWYRNCPGVFYTTTTSECADALKKIDDGFKVNSKEVENYLLGLEKKCVIGYLDPLDRDSSQITYEEYVNEMYRWIVSIIK